MATTEITKFESMNEIERAATAMVKSKFFADAAEVSQAVVKIMAGQEIGIGAFASMSGIHIIKGRPTYGANILAAKVKGSGKYDYRVKEISEKACEVEFFEGGKSLGPSRFTIEDARKAGTQNTDKFPRNMLFARAISNGIKWYCPDVLGGVTAYVPEEFGAIVDDDNNVIIDAVSTSSTPAPKAPWRRPTVDEILGESHAEKMRDLPKVDSEDDGKNIPAAAEPKLDFERYFLAEAAYKDACETLASNGEKYGDRATDKLAAVANNPKTPLDKKRAAMIILNWRANHPA